MAPRSRTLLLILVPFLIGLLPPLVAMFQAQSELRSTREELRLERLRTLAGKVYLETSRNNFGIASQAATELFVQAQQMHQSAPEDRQPVLQSVLDKRGKLTSELAAANAEARATAESILVALQP